MEQPIDLTHYASKIMYNVYLGGEKAASNFHLLTNFGIKYILIAAKECIPRFVGKFIYLHVPIEDSEDQDLLQNLDLVLKFIEMASKNGKILIHCAEGRSRSVALVTAYVMFKHKCKFQIAYKYIKKKHPPTLINHSFEKQLDSLNP